MPPGIMTGIAAMAAIVVASNILVQFLVGDWLTLGAFTYPFAFLVTDLVNRFRGAAAARKVVLFGFAAGILCSFAGTQIEGEFGPLVTLRIALGSAAAFLAAQLLDVLIFDRLRRGRWWRAPLVSSLAGSTLDTALSSSSRFRPASRSLSRRTTSLGRTRPAGCSASAPCFRSGFRLPSPTGWSSSPSPSWPCSRSGSSCRGSRPRRHERAIPGAFLAKPASMVQIAGGRRGVAVRSFWGCRRQTVGRAGRDHDTHFRQNRIAGFGDPRNLPSRIRSRRPEREQGCYGGRTQVRRRRLLGSVIWREGAAAAACRTALDLGRGDRHHSGDASNAGDESVGGARKAGAAGPGCARRAEAPR